MIRRWSIPGARLLADHTAAVLVLRRARYLVRTEEELELARAAVDEQTQAVLRDAYEHHQRARRARAAA